MQLISSEIAPQRNEEHTMTRDGGLENLSYSQKWKVCDSHRREIFSTIKIMINLSSYKLQILSVKKKSTFFEFVIDLSK